MKMMTLLNCNSNGLEMIQISQTLQSNLRNDLFLTLAYYKIITLLVTTLQILFYYTSKTYERVFMPARKIPSKPLLDQE